VIHSILEDKEGTLWVGGYLGLFRFDGKSFARVSNDGPWKMVSAPVDKGSHGQ
jgi:ligand-binding sensor domain-containing protein